MSTNEKRLPLDRAQRLAVQIVRDFFPACERIEVAGSIRRRKADIGDIEIVAIPKRLEDFFGEGDSLLDPILENLCRLDVLKKVKGGDKMKQYEITKSGIMLDLFLCRPENFGLILAIRTGPAEWSHRMVTPRSQGGLMPSHLRSMGGFIKDGSGKVYEVPEEADLFRILGIEFLEPWERR